MLCTVARFLFVLLEHTHTHTHNRTATPDGIMMTQVLSTFNRLEQSRFEAFRRATFRGDAVSAYVAHTLSAGHEQAYSRSERTRQLLNATGLGMGNPRYEIAMKQSAALLRQEQRRQRQDTTTTTTTASSMSLRLEDMVAPGQADGIVVVVSTLAKAYAQRLVAAARRVATATGYDGNQPLLPSHLQQAHTSRVQAGLDPGFFLMPSGNKCTGGVVASSAIQAAALGTQDEYEMLRSATLQAQEEYDQYMASQPKQQEQLLLLQQKQEQQGSAGPPPEAKFVELEPEPVTIPEPEPEAVVKETTTTTPAAKPDDDNLAAAAAPVEPVAPKVEDEVAPAAALPPPPLAPDNLDLDSAMLHETSALDDLPEADMGFLDDASGDDEQIGQSLEDALLNDLDDDSD